MRYLEHERSFVVSGRFRRGRRNDRKARDVVWVVFDVRNKDRQVVVCAGLSACDGSSIWIVFRAASGFCGARDFEQIRVWQMPRKPVAALRERLRLAINRFYIATHARSKQAVMYP